MSHKILIIEDELLAYNRLCKALIQLQPDIYIYPQQYSIVSALHWFEMNDEPDIIFLDVHLSDGSSFEIFKHRSIQAPIIFTTAYDQYAVDAFKLNSIHYLMKPVNPDDLAAAFNKFKQYHYNKETLLKLSQPTQSNTQQFLIKLGNKYITVSMKDISSFYSKEKLSFIYTKSKMSYPIDQSLDKLFEHLDQQTFFRVNRQLITRREDIQSFQTKEKSKLLLQVQPEPPVEPNVSSERSAEFKKWWGQKL